MEKARRILVACWDIWLYLKELDYLLRLLFSILWHFLEGFMEVSTGLLIRWFRAPVCSLISLDSAAYFLMEAHWSKDFQIYCRYLSVPGLIFLSFLMLIILLQDILMYCLGSKWYVWPILLTKGVKLQIFPTLYWYILHYG